MPLSPTQALQDSLVESGISASSATEISAAFAAQYTALGVGKASLKVAGGIRLIPTGKNLGAAGTAHGCVPCPHRFTHVQIVMEGTSAATGIKVAAAASSIRGNGYTPKLADAVTDNVFTPITFGTTDPNDMANPGGGSATGSIPAGSVAAADTDFVAGRTYSDIIALPSIERADGGTNRLLMVRGYLNAAGLPAGSFASLNPNNIAANPRGTIQSLEPDWAGGYQLSATDFIAAPGSYAPTGFDWMFPAEVRFWTERMLVSVEGNGDSTMMGWKPATYPIDANEGGQFNGWLRQSIALLQAQGLPFVLSSTARVGQKSTYLDNSANRLPNSRPRISVLQAWTSNDGGSTQAIYDASFTKLLNNLRICQRVGTVPVIVVPWPQNLNAADDTLRKAFVARVRNIGGFQIDLDALTSDGATPARMLPAYQPSTGFDGTHPGSLGDALVAAYAAPILRQAAGL